MSLADAEEFARHIKRRTGRYPLLYTNGSTVKFIPESAKTIRSLLKLNPRDARYKPGHCRAFPRRRVG